MPAPPSATPARPGIAVPRAGRYLYDTVEEGRDEVGPTRATYVQTAEVDAPVAREDGVSIEIRTTSPRSEEVAGEVFRFRRGGIDLLFADACALDRPAAHYRLPLRVGASWPSPRTCDGESDTATTRVIGRATLLIGGVSVDTFEIRRTASLSGLHRTKTQWFAPAYMVVVRSDLRDTIDGEPHSIVQTLRSLRPA